MLCRTLLQSRLTMDHVIHGPPPPVWEMEPETQSYLVKAVVSLLQEAKPFGSRFGSEQEEAHRRTMQVQKCKKIRGLGCVNRARAR